MTNSNPQNLNSEELDGKLKEILGEEDFKYTDKPARIMALIESYASQSRRDEAQKIRDLVGWEEEPQFDPGDATYGDTDHDHNAVMYGINSAKGRVQGIIETRLAELAPKGDKR